MAFIAECEEDFETWDYVLGDIYKGMSMAVDRYSYLMEMDSTMIY